MEEFDLNLDEAKFPNVVRTYGKNPFDLAVNMALAYSSPGTKESDLTRTDLISCMINLEDDMEHERLMSDYDIAEEFPEDTVQIRLDQIKERWGHLDYEEIGAFKGGVLYGFSTLLYNYNPDAPRYALAIGYNVKPIYSDDELYQEAYEFAVKCGEEEEEEEDYDEDWDEDEELEDDEELVNEDWKGEEELDEGELGEGEKLEGCEEEEAGGIED